MTVDVILASGDSAFYQSLQNPNLVFNIVDITKVIFAGEIPPDKMYKLLTTRWGMGHNLAVTSIDHYGGHIYDMFRYLKGLAEKSKDYTAISAT